MMVFGVIVICAMLSALVLCAALWPLARHADRRGAPGLLHGRAGTLRAAVAARAPRRQAGTPRTPPQRVVQLTTANSFRVPGIQEVYSR